LNDAKHLSQPSVLDGAAFRSAVQHWYLKNGRDLPWRRTRDPYAILVSEFMLQQTQVAAVVPYYHRWLQRFPTFASLALAGESDVLHAWEGLGYYNRARSLHAAAKAVVRDHGGILPNDPDTIRALPGIGRYTANAVVTFAFDAAVPIVEANTGRLLSRLTNMREPIDTIGGREALWRAARALVPQKHAGTYNSALTDLGALICGRVPKCNICPVRRSCRAPDPQNLPRKRARATRVTLTENHSFIYADQRVLLERANDRWRGMWILPRLKTTRQSERPVHTSAFPFTHHRITLAVYIRRSVPHPRVECRWFTASEIETIPMPSPHRRALTQCVETVAASHSTSRNAVGIRVALRPRLRSE
jgi:A/G-specific adenine glycosylase